MFKLFAEFIEHIEEDLAEQYDERRHRIEEIRRKNVLALQERQKKEAQQIKEPPPIVETSEDTTGDDDDDDEDEIAPYNRDREQLQKLVEQSSNDMYEALKINFFPQMAYFQRRYPSRCKDLTTTIEEVLHLFEEQLLNGILPKLNDEEFEEFDIQYNSQKADMSHEDEPPTAR